MRRRQVSSKRRGDDSGSSAVGAVLQGHVPKQIQRTEWTWTTSTRTRSDGVMGGRVSCDSQRQRSHARSSTGKEPAVAAAHGWPEDAGTDTTGSKAHLADFSRSNPRTVDDCEDTINAAPVHARTGLGSNAHKSPLSGSEKE